jgi:hypothetical protein
MAVVESNAAVNWNWNAKNIQRFFFIGTGFFFTCRSPMEQFSSVFPGLAIKNPPKNTQPKKTH